MPYFQNKKNQNARRKRIQRRKNKSKNRTKKTISDKEEPVRDPPITRTKKYIEPNWALQAKLNDLCNRNGGDGLLALYSWK